MIAAYAQASSRQGLDVAVDGEEFGLDDRRFAALRAKGMGLNLKDASRVLEGVEVRFGAGVLRLDLVEDEEGSTDRSPAVVVVSVEELNSNSSETVRRIIATMNAIGRSSSVDQIEAAVVAGRQVAALRARNRIVISYAIAAVVIGVASVCIVRMWNGAR